jgi:uncharacterized protein YndB with AHSA1/START domain
MEFDVFTPEFAHAPAVDSKEPSRLQVERRAAIWVTRKFEASPERVFDAWLDPDIAGKWLFATESRPITRARIDARVGGAFCFVDHNDGEHIEHTGVYIEITRPWSLAFTLSAGNHQQMITRVVAQILPRRKGCEVIVTHEDVPGEFAGRIESRWTGMLYGLAMTLGLQADDNPFVRRKTVRPRGLQRRMSAVASPAR